jgi:hypothetical protein
MQQGKDMISTDRDKILARAPVRSSTSSFAAEMRLVVIQAVDARRRERGQAEAIFGAARDLRISARRVTAFLRGGVGRVWADEWDHARRWHAGFLARQAVALAEQAQSCAARAAAVRDSLE